VGLFTLEHGKVAYLADFGFYGASIVALAALLLAAGQSVPRLEVVTLVVIGLISWTVIEYGLHRFVFHGVQPFRRWHSQHHQRPRALICTPTLLSAALIAALVYLPALAVVGRWRACGLTLGVLIGYLAYGITHHATHHWRPHNSWLKRRKIWHALHHQHTEQLSCYGVTSSFWDHVFGSIPRQSD
jgi:sterol desaturase/sphingolipid hydroxylase (fatty acid hydroxylase superfamily)